MTSTKNRAEFEIEVDGEPYIWRLQRLPQWSSDTSEWRGKSIALRHKNGKREAVVEFPPEPPKFGAPPLKPSKIPKALVARAIQSALAAGWSPMSRGKTVGIIVDAAGG
jgi:hypothetical protein